MIGYACNVTKLAAQSASEATMLLKMVDVRVRVIYVDNQVLLLNVSAMLSVKHPKRIRASYQLISSIAACSTHDANCLSCYQGGCLMCKRGFGFNEAGKCLRMYTV